MNIDSLIKQANQIGEFFGAWPDRDQARLEITNHLKRFWDPRMRRQIGDYVDTQGGASLDPIVIEAIAALGPEKRPDGSG